MQSSRRELLDDFLAYVNAAGDANARNQAERLLNRVLQTIWLKRGWRCFIDPDVWQFSTVANQRGYALPDHFGRISGNNRVIRNLTKGTRILPKDRSDLEEMDPTQGTTFEVPGAPSTYEIAGMTPVQVQPASTGDALEVISDNAADTTVRVYLEGLSAAGLVVQSQVTLNGTNAVALGTWTRVLKFGKAYADGTAPTVELTSSVGHVTLRKVAGAVALQVLAPEQSAREHQQIVFYPQPDSIYVIGLPILRAPQRIYFDADPLPPFWENAIFDKMVRAWRVGDRDVPDDPTDTWPALVDLVCYDNAQAAQERRTRQPFRGV